MEKRKLKKFVLPTLYVLVIVATFFSISLLNNYLLKDEINYDFSKSLMKGITEATLGELKEDEIEVDTILKPYKGDNVEAVVTYYSKNDDESKQQKSLILYEGTYMPCSGIFYTSNETIDVQAVYEGKVTNIKEDEILGTVIEITHNPNLITYYYSLKDVVVSLNEEVKPGTILGRATTNKINSEKDNFLFEVYYQGKSLDPEKFYTMKANELQ